MTEVRIPCRPAGAYTVHHSFRIVMHIKTRGKRAMLYRSSWIQKGAEANTHGFARQHFVGSLPIDAEAVPNDLAARLSNEEQAFVQRTIVIPAKAAAESTRREAERKARDPMWRLDEALRLVREAAALSADAHVPNGRVKSIADALSDVKSLGSAPRQEPRRGDPIEDALEGLRAAGRAVAAGHYGQAPAEGIRRSKVYADWIEIVREVEGATAQGGLLRALQRAGWVKAKTR